MNLSLPLLLVTVGAGLAATVPALGQTPSGATGSLATASTLPDNALTNGVAIRGSLVFIVIGKQKGQKGKAATLVQDPRLIWVDAMWITPEGKLYMPAVQIDRTPTFNDGRMSVHFPMQVFTVDIGNGPPANDHRWQA